MHYLIYKRERQGILNANSRFAKNQKSQIRKLRYNRSQLGFKKSGKRSRSVFSQKISEANYNKRAYERFVADAQMDIINYDQKIAEFTKLLAAFQPST